MKKILSALLSASIVLSFIACGSAEEKPAPQTGETYQSEIADVPAETELRDNVPELDFGGNTITFSTTESYHYEFDVDELTGEITNDAVYERNLMMEERFNVVIEKTVTDNRDTQTTFIRNTIMSGDNAFDVAAHFVYLAGGLILEDLFLDWKNVPYVEMDREWWVRKINDSFTINGRLFAAVSDLCITNMQLAYVYLFNHQIADNYGIEDLYAVVDDGRWTLDYMRDLTSSVYEDLNGNAKNDDSDLYGLLTDTITSLDCYFLAADQPTIRETENGLEELVGSPRAVQIYEKVYSLFYDNPGARPLGDYEKKHPMFMNSQGLLMPIRLHRLYGQMRDMDVDFGILPFPKLNEEQKEYFNTCLDNYSVLMIPKNTKDLEMVGALTEAMSFESMKSVVPAFYETALQEKYTRDKRSVDMLDLIMSSRVFDVTILYNSFLSGGNLAHILRFTIGSKKDYVSFYEKNKPSFDEQLSQLYDNLQMLGG